ncbi:MAG: nucleoside triphosphate pyrophosphohydrolase [Anaerolineaceae bacterium]
METLDSLSLFEWGSWQVSQWFKSGLTGKKPEHWKNGMTQTGIVIVGLGAAGAELLTREAWEWLSGAKEVYLRTCLHPSAVGLPEHLQIHSFDEVYEQHDNLEEVFAEIVETILRLGCREEGVTYAVPGSPWVAEETSTQILSRAREAGIPVRVIDGLSFVEPVCAALGVDPASQLALVDAMQLASQHVPSFPPSCGVLVSQIGTRMDATEVKLTLMTNYPDDYPVRLVHAAGTAQQIVEDLILHTIDQSPHLGLLSTLYVPPRERGRSFEDFQEIIACLRAPDGCPWDREQTHLSLRPYLLQETYEVLETLDREDLLELQEELGDLLLQIVLHTQIATEEEDFNMTDVIAGISSKLIRRHPHVFGEVQVNSVDNVLLNWEKIKAREREQNGNGSKNGMLDGIPLALPALTQADQIQRRAKRVGFDWQEIDPVIAKVHEELGELQAARNQVERQSEAGDLLFAAVNLIRWLDIDPETALRECNLRFRKRFSYIEAAAAREGKSVEELSFAQMDALWEQAKDIFAAEDEESKAEEA